MCICVWNIVTWVRRGAWHHNQSCAFTMNNTDIIMAIECCSWILTACIPESALAINLTDASRWYVPAQLGQTLGCSNALTFGGTNRRSRRAWTMNITPQRISCKVRFEPYGYGTKREMIPVRMAATPIAEILGLGISRLSPKKVMPVISQRAELDSRFCPSS